MIKDERAKKEASSNSSSKPLKVEFDSNNNDKDLFDQLYENQQKQLNNNQ